ncbi:MAG TPA: hypothetical protein HA252_04000 [Candidatus Diapherotrites archaeon]|uniref:Uncharacterized protein n=1 Tax=Candidatus Iainarchaeum sp. TaxID=3101447 RepID=A0A7J4JHL0_9ARCH|nr:hypothetical protein [Candidatus Diapherotrites archaeon]
MELVFFLGDEDRDDAARDGADEVGQDFGQAVGDVAEGLEDAGYQAVLLEFLADEHPDDGRVPAEQEQGSRAPHEGEKDGQAQDDGVVGVNEFRAPP